MLKRILVIDDDEGLRDIIRFSLEATTDWQVLTAASGQTGLAIAATEQPDSILLDLTMPGMNGIVTFERLRSDRMTQHIPTILLTAQVHPYESDALVAIGVRGVIAKPFEPQNLGRQICAILNWKR